MGRITTSPPSPAIIVAALALVAALAGTAIAGPGETTSALTKSKVKKIATRQINALVPGIADEQITRRAPDLSVAHANSANTATNATTANSATQAENAINAANAASAQPAAFAHVSGTGVLDVANSKNVGSVSRVGEGVYCFSGIPFAPRGGQATVDPIGGMDEHAQFDRGLGDCPGAQPGVDTFDATGALSDAPFYVVFYE